MTYQERLNRLIESLNDVLNHKPLPITKRAFTRETKGKGTEQIYEMVCNGCGKEFESNRSHTLWHDNSCSKRVSRGKSELKILLHKVIEYLEQSESSQKPDKSKS